MDSSPEYKFGSIIPYRMYRKVYFVMLSEVMILPKGGSKSIEEKGGLFPAILYDLSRFFVWIFLYKFFD